MKEDLTITGQYNGQERDKKKRLLAIDWKQVLQSTLKPLTK